jgi:putative transposase
VPTPGKNRRQPVFGAVNFATGKFLYKLWPRNNNVGFRLMLAKVVTWAQRHRKHVILVLDNGPVNTAKAVQTYLNNETVKQYLTVFWLPKYCPDLNDIEPLWSHVKKNGMANVLYRSFLEFQRALTQTLESLNGDPDDMLAILYARQRRKSIRIKLCKVA